MNDGLREQLKRLGWRSSARYKNSLASQRAGIEFDLGAVGEDRVELRYRYMTERTSAEGAMDLPADVTLERIGDAMTGLYLQIHERPDPSRTFRLGSGKRRVNAPAPPAAPAPAPSDDTQGALDL